MKKSKSICSRCGLFLVEANTHPKRIKPSQEICWDCVRTQKILIQPVKNKICGIKTQDIIDQLRRPEEIRIQTGRGTVAERRDLYKKVAAANRKKWKYALSYMSPVQIKGVLEHYRSVPKNHFITHNLYYMTAQDVVNYDQQQIRLLNYREIKKDIRQKIPTEAINRYLEDNLSATYLRRKFKVTEEEAKDMMYEMESIL